ncbi:MAG: carbohydrate ABC transporter permease, partial [Ruthenibacterium sp.]
MRKTKSKKKKIYLRKTTSKLMMTLVMGFAALGIIYPFAWMVSASFKRPADIFEFPIKWIPDYLYLDNYQYIFTNKTYDFLGMYGNSIKVTVISVAGALLVSILAAYGFSKLKFPGRDKIFLLFIAMMIIPNQVLMVPRFIIFQWLGIINTHAALIIPGFFVILNTFLLRQYFVQIPDAISESAFID